MAYDDDGSRFNFQDLEDIAILFERYLSAPENLTAARLIALTQAVHGLRGHPEGGQPGMKQLAAGLRERGLANVPFDTVIRVFDFVSPFKKEDDALARVTLRDVKHLISR